MPHPGVNRLMPHPVQRIIMNSRYSFPQCGAVLLGKCEPLAKWKCNTLYTTFICSTTPLQEPQILKRTELFIISQLFNDSVNDWMDHKTITEAWVLKNTHWALQFSGCNYCFIFGRSHVQISVPRLAILTEACYSSQAFHVNARASPQINEPLLHFPFFPTKYSSSYQLTPQSELWMAYLNKL